jgi:hypothetical protein
MNWAVWYYSSPSFPVLQAVYPDLENRFPEEQDFDKTFEQPLLQAGGPLEIPRLSACSCVSFQGYPQRG